MSKTVQALQEVKKVRETKTSELPIEDTDILSGDSDVGPGSSSKRRFNFELIFFSLMSILVVASFLMSYVALARLRDAKVKTRDYDMQFVGFFDDQKKKVSNIQKTLDLMTTENDRQLKDFQNRLNELSKSTEKVQNDLNALNTSNLQLRSYVNDLNRTISAEIQKLKNRK